LFHNASPEVGDFIPTKKKRRKFAWKSDWEVMVPGRTITFGYVISKR